MPSPRIDTSLIDQEYFLTFTIIDWIDIFTSQEYFEIIISILKYYQTNLQLSISGYVIMTNHIHIIARCADMIRFIQSFKSYSSKEISNLILSDNRKHLRKLLQKFQKKRYNTLSIWQPNNWPIIIETVDFFQQKLDYIHENPVAKGYVEREEDWVYSSARNYINNDHSIIKVETN